MDIDGCGWWFCWWEWLGGRRNRIFGYSGDTSTGDGNDDEEGDVGATAGGEGV